MHKTIRHLGLLVLLSASSLATGAEAPSFSKELEPLQRFVGKTWKGRFRQSTPEKPMYDVMKWERALNGQAIRILHSINQGEYGGETILMWNPKISRLEYHYFTTAGFFTHGTMTIEGNKITAHEEVTGNKNGVTEVEATMEILADGRMHSKSLYLQNGKWVDGHEVSYEESPGAEVVFR
ncbi:MAG: hypothetical protein HY735_28450 [Verrucomicrobia bacterium]|nr:hypothetical protein [Verrucomicrobiota bacterium]